MKPRIPTHGYTDPLDVIWLRTAGEIGWRERGFAKANTVEADGKLVILDEDGVLCIATATPEKRPTTARAC